MFGTDPCLASLMGSGWDGTSFHLFIIGHFIGMVIHPQSEASHFIASHYILLISHPLMTFVSLT